MKIPGEHMGIMSNSYSTLTEKELFELLKHVISGPSEDHKNKRIAGLEELQRRIKSDSIQNLNEYIEILLEMARKQGHNRPESLLVVDSLLLLINRYEKAFQIVLNGLRGKGQEENLLFLVFSKLVLKLDYNKKRQAIKSLIHFLISRDVINDIGVNEVYNCLLSLGNEKLGTEIVKEISSYLDSLKICAVLSSVRLCSKFADHQLLSKMLKVLKKSMKGYFDGYSDEIEREICMFLKRIKDPQSLPLLLELLKMRCDRQYSHISKAIGSILDANPYRIDDVLDMLYDQRDGKVVDAFLRSFEEMDKTRLNARKLLSKIRINWWSNHPTNVFVHRLLVKNGEYSKPVLFELLKDEEKYDFALRCLKEIGVSNEELSNLFPKPVMLQVYNFLYSKVRSKKIPKDLNQLWKDKSKLNENVPGNTNWLEHLLLHIFASFNFVTLNVAPLKVECIDLVCFYPETLDLFVIGCTTGILKDDLAKMDALLDEMEKKMPDLFDKCTITPIVVSSRIASVPPSDAQYAAQLGIVIMQSYNIDVLLEMLSTNRKTEEVIKYIKILFP